MVRRGVQSVRVPLEALAQAHAVGSLFWILAKVQVVPARGVREQVHHPDLFARFPWIVEPHFRRQCVKGGIVERQLAWSTSIRIDSETKAFEVEPMRKIVSAVAARLPAR